MTRHFMCKNLFSPLDFTLVYHDVGEVPIQFHMHTYIGLKIIQEVLHDVSWPDRTEEVQLFGRISPKFRCFFRFR